MSVIVCITSYQCALRGAAGLWAYEASIDLTQRAILGGQLCYALSFGHYQRLLAFRSITLEI